MSEKKKPLVSVTWRDAHGSATAAFNEHEIPHAPLIVTTYGLLLRDDDVGVTVANEVCGDGTYRGLTFVPKELIVEVKRPRAKARKPATLPPSAP